MTSQQLGSSFEIITKDYFIWLFEKIGFTIIKDRIQFAGTQDGFDILVVIVKDYKEQRIFIECKHYSNDLDIGNIFKKAFDLEKTHKLNENDLFIAINPKSNFKNQDNAEKTTPILDEKFRFRNLMLDLSNGVKELFALNNLFYKQLYGNDVDFNLEEEKEIKRFESIIFSRKPFKKIIIEESDKLNFIGNIVLPENIIERELAKDIAGRIGFFWLTWLDKFKFKQTLSKVLELENKIFLLGNPGTGKTTELINFALSNWKTGEIEGYVPIFKSLRDFTTTDSLENYLPNKWDELTNIFLILDGIDEIADIEYFKSKLITFFEKNSAKNFKCIISCRTNVYESLVRDVSGFKKYFLKDLTQYESVELLRDKCGKIIDDLYTDFNDTHYNFLKTPFQVEILANYIINHKTIPKNTHELWREYIDMRLTKDKNDKLKKISLKAPLIKKYSKKVALVNELMKTNIIHEDNLFTLTNDNNDDYKEFLKNPLIDKQLNSDNYYFVHRNIQEFFAAELISTSDLKEIIDFVSIKGTNRTHPSLFNTITFLINILDDDKCSKFIDWISENEPELLFKADKDRIENFRIRVFQDYFKRECIEKTFWINHNRTYSVKEIAEFADCEANFNYLVDLIKNKSSHYRVIISALDLLTHFTIPSNMKESLKSDFFILLKESKIRRMVKSHILDCIHDHKLYNHDEKYLNEIFNLFKEETDKQINRSLLSLLEDLDNIDAYFWYVKAEFLRDKGITKREIKDDVMRGNAWALEDLIIRLNSADDFIEIAKYYFDETKTDYTDNTFFEKIIDRCLYFESIDDNFLIKLFSSFEEKTAYYFNESLIKKMILNSKVANQIKVFEYLLDNFEFRNIGYFLASVTSEETIQIVIEKFKDATIEKSNLDFYRNVIANHGNRKLAAEFNNEMIYLNFTFNERFLNKDEFDALMIKYKVMPQNDFDILFDKKRLLQKIKGIFKEYGKSINPTQMRNIDMDWYEKNGHGNKIEISYSLLSRITHRKKTDLQFKNVEKALEDELIIIKEIKSQIEGLNKDNNQFVISKEQEEFIFDWCKKAANEIRFDKVMGFISVNNFNLLPDYEKLKLILYFIIKFDFDFNQEFLLNSLEFFDVDKSSEDSNNLYALRLKINDDKLFDQRIIYNLLNKKLFSFSLDRHIQYALDNNLVETFPKIKEYFLIKEYNHNIDKKLAQFVDLTGDINLLKELCNNVESHVCWSSLKILMNLKLEKDFCIRKSTEYLETEISDEKNYYYSSAMSLLFELNSLSALKYIFTYLDIEKVPSLNQYSYSDYDTIEEYTILEKLFDKIYINNRDKIGFSGVDKFLTSFVSNLSKKEESFNLTQAELNRIKDKQKDSDTGLFHINQLIDDSKASYINSQSKALKFNEALFKAQQILT